MIKPDFLYPLTKAPSRKQEFSRLLTAAVINSHFCSLLLNDPLTAAAEGYDGERFALNPQEMNALNTIHAASLRDFAAQLAVL